MDVKFDIFKKLPDGQPLWLKAVTGLEEAKQELSHLAIGDPGDYFIFDTRSGRVIAAPPNGFRASQGQFDADSAG